MAARVGSVSCVKILLQHHATVDHKEKYGNTALHYTAEPRGTSDGQFGCSKYLLNAGANINAQDVTGKTPLQYCVESDARNIAAILLDTGADIDRSTNDGMSPLLAAIYYNWHRMLHFLIEHGATWTTKARFGTVFHIAASKADAAMMSILKTEIGASAKRGLLPIPSNDTKDKDGHNAKDIMANQAAQNPELVPLFVGLLESVSQD